MSTVKRLSPVSFLTIFTVLMVAVSFGVKVLSVRNVSIFSNDRGQFWFDQRNSEYKIKFISLDQGRGFHSGSIKIAFNGKVKEYFSGMVISKQEKDNIVSSYGAKNVVQDDILKKLLFQVMLETKKQDTLVFIGKTNVSKICVTTDNDKFVINYINAGDFGRVSDTIFIGQDENEKTVFGVGDFSPQGAQVIGNSLIIPSGAGYFLTYYREGGRISQNELAKICKVFKLVQIFPPLKK